MGGGGGRATLAGLRCLVHSGKAGEGASSAAHAGVVLEPLAHTVIRPSESSRAVKEAGRMRRGRNERA